MKPPLRLPKSWKKWIRAGISLGLIALGLAVVFPILYAIAGAFKTSAEFTARPPAFFPADWGNGSNFAAVWTRIPLLRMLLNSLVLSLLGSAVRLALAILAAYAFVFYEFKGKKFLFFFLLSTMMLPVDTLTVTNYQTVSRLGLTDSYLGMAIVSFVGASQMFMLRQHFKTVPPTLWEAGQIDGCGDVRFLLSILLPLSRPTLVTLFLQCFITLWNSYLWPLLVTNRTDMRPIQVGIAMLTSLEATNYQVVLAGVALALIPSFVLFALLRKSITRSLTAGSLVG